MGTAHARSGGRPSGVLFDAAETLFTLTPPLSEIIAELISRHGGPPARARIEHAIEHIGGTVGWPDDQPTHAARVEAWAAFLDSAIRSSGIEGIDRCRAEIAEKAAVAVTETHRYSLFSDVSATLSRMAAAGVPVGVVSNFDDLLFDILRATGLDRAFPIVITSYRTGVSKPDPLIFQEAIAAARVHPTHTYYVGDSVYSDMEGARRSGLRGALIDRNEAHPDYSGVRIKSLLELCPLLGV
ncbi:HAD family hydrolase [Streptomyces sioyaensis]|uniref:HAD family hydrolase n=1 Tax=Streptomyces sioyaensis TaxID=67364 RepID=UPI003787AEC7